MIYRGADKSLARPGRKQAKRPNSNFRKPLKKKSEGCPSNQVSAVAMTFVSDEKWRTFNCFFSRVGLRTYQHPCICVIRNNKMNFFLLIYFSNHPLHVSNILTIHLQEVVYCIRSIWYFNMHHQFHSDSASGQAT